MEDKTKIFHGEPQKFALYLIIWALECLSKHVKQDEYVKNNI